MSEIKVNLSIEIKPLSTELSENTKKYLVWQKWANDVFEISTNELLRIPKIRL